MWTVRSLSVLSPVTVNAPCGTYRTLILAVPASHVTGIVAVILPMLRAGGRTVLMPAFRARTFLELAMRERMTFALIVPAMYNLCLLEPDFAQFDLSAWRMFMDASPSGAMHRRTGESAE